MPDDRPSLDDRIKSLGESVERLQRHLPSPLRTRTLAPLARPVTPEGTVRAILWVIAAAAGLALVGDVVAICFDRDERVFVAREGGKLQVWSDASAFEAATGEECIGRPNDTELVAVYHDAKRNLALRSWVGHLLLMVLSLVALKQLRAPSSLQTPHTP